MASKVPRNNEDALQWRPIGAYMTNRRRMLVVDDYAYAAHALQLLLIANGFECRAMHGAADVCELATEWQPFTVVLDIAMPCVEHDRERAREAAHPARPARSDEASHVR